MTTIEDLRRMADDMRTRARALMAEADALDPPQAVTTEAEMRALMRDPRYWRLRDPDVVRRVTDGFRRLVQCQQDLAEIERAAGIATASTEKEPRT